jgi:negative regulator of flagellin synthesis FlgM
VTTKIGSGGIDNRPSQVGTDRAIKRTANNETTAPQTADAGKSGGQGVHITDSARQLAALEQAIRSMPEVNDVKVAEIRTAIANGTYQVAPERIAEKLLRLEQEFLATNG